MVEPKESLREKIAAAGSVSGIIGLGYVGLPLARHLVDAGYSVVGFDVDEEKIRKILSGESYIKHVDDAWIRQSVDSDTFTATSDFSRLSEMDCISICVPTPLDEHSQPDLHYVRDTTESIATYLRPGQLIILESTTYPGTTVELLLPILSASGLEVGKDFFLVYSPEREDPGNPRYNIRTIPKVVGGVTPACSELAIAYYGRIFDQVVRVGNPAVAEMSKLLENIFRSVNIALVNEMKMLCDSMEIDIWEVIDAAATKPFGFMPFYPGPGLGGHCIPIDPFYLSWKAREYDFSARFIELAGEINTRMPYYVVSRAIEILNAKSIPVKGARFLILGMAYKQDVDDVRESPTFKLIELLRKHGATVDYNDPHVPTISHGRKYDLRMESVPLTEKSLGEYDCILISTAHSAYDFDFIVKHAALVIDTRNATKHVAEYREKIWKA